MSQIASQKPLRAARRLIKAASSTPSQGDGLGRRLIVGIETHNSRGDCSKAASAQLVRGSACGPLKRAMVRRFRMSSSAAGPRRGGQSKGNGVGHSTHRAEGNQRDQMSHSLLACSCVRPGVPQFGKQLPAPGRLFSCAGSGAESSRSRSLHTHQRIMMYSWIHLYRHPKRRISARLDRPAISSLVRDASSRSSFRGGFGFRFRHSLTDQQLDPWSATHYLALPFVRGGFGFRFS
jgi:hypothetical protein